MKATKTFTGIGLAVASMLLVSSLSIPAQAQNGSATPAGQTVLTYQNRLYLNPFLPVPQALVAFYFTSIAGLTGPLFTGQVSESTAYFTASFDNSGTAIIPNGDVSTAVFDPGKSFRVYYNPAPNRSWSDPAGFSTGQLVATFKSTIGTSTQTGPVTSVMQSYVLDSSADFVFQGKSYNFRQLIPHGFTVASGVTGGNLGSAGAYPLVFAAAGSAFAIGGELSTLPRN